jgi:hypothetical protein
MKIDVRYNNGEYQVILTGFNSILPHPEDIENDSFVSNLPIITSDNISDLLKSLYKIIRKEIEYKFL